MTTTDLHRDEVLELDPTRLALVGDVGGTNARFALVDPDLDPTRLISAMSLRCKDYATPAAAIADFVARTGLGRLPTFAVIAAAGPVNEGVVHMTNLAWTLSEADLRGQGFLSARLLNDYAAAAFAAPLLDFHDAPCLGGPASAPEYETLAVLGAGTGFGVSALARDPFAGDVFVFRGRSGSLIKCLWHDGIGLSLYAKRLERGRFIWPSTVGGVVCLTTAQMGYLLDGIDWRNPQQSWRPTRAG